MSFQSFSYFAFLPVVAFLYLKVCPRCPGLCVPLDAAVSGTAYNIRTGIVKGLMNGFIGDVAHNVGHHR